MMRDLRKGRAANQVAYDDGRIDSSTFKSNRSLIGQREKAIVTAFNTRWNEAVEASTPPANGATAAP